ncbi:hypothetical protein DK880_00934 [Candidatus Cardinium hertigii]|uniref:Uncharacterized protein n=1 Tax=Candidatus Cardinium hertigii TaxID=247481 RepID=A0A2Z3LDS1_9BACT|nr:hypothetical protein DK880_00934 [Candidatus Cardinium hertigii]
MPSCFNPTWIAMHFFATFLKAFKAFILFFYTFVKIIIAICNCLKIKIFDTLQVFICI